MLYLDGIYFEVRHGDQVDPTIILAAMGVDLEGTKEILAIRACAQESQDGWLSLLQDLRTRGVSEVDLIVTDGHEGLLAALAALFTATPRQRCLVHKQPSADECYSQTRTRTDWRRISRHLAPTRAVSKL